MVGEILLAHLVGDYIIQSDWMARRKVVAWWPAIVHGLTYTAPFWLVTQSWAALAVIAGTHVVIDRFRLARYVIWISNWAAPMKVQFRTGTALIRVESSNPPWAECKATGFPASRPVWLAVWLMFIVDNTMHLLINVAAVAWL